MSSRKRVYAVHGDTTMPRKRFRRTSDTLPEPKFAPPGEAPAATIGRRKKYLRARRTPVKAEPMDVDMKTMLHKRRSAHNNDNDSDSDRQAKRARSTPMRLARKDTSTMPVPAASKRAARKETPAVRRAAREAIPTMPKRALRKPTPPVEEPEPMIEEIIAEGAGHVPPRSWVPPAPAVHAAMLEDGRVCVRIVRQNGIVQNVIIDNPQF